MELAQAVLNGDRRAVARAISLVERRDAEAQTLLNALHPHTGQAYLIGITGAPGTGKSTIVNGLAHTYREQGIRVGIIATDPTSPFSGGALLGDRIRMRDVTADQGIFMRSMATRGALGGLSWTTFEAIQVLDAAGYEVILIETVGAGQDEVEIARTAYTVVVVEAPGLGDDIQAIKAGLIEIADIFVVNKADREGAAQAVRALEMTVGLDSALAAADEETWQPPVCQTIAIKETGIQELYAQIEAHRSHLDRSGELQERALQRIRANMETMLRETLFTRYMSQLEPRAWEKIVRRVANRKLAPLEALNELLSDER